MVRGNRLVGARTWHAPSIARRMAEAEFNLDRDLHYENKEALRTQLQYQINEAAREIDAMKLENAAAMHTGPYSAYGGLAAANRARRFSNMAAASIPPPEPMMAPQPYMMDTIYPPQHVRAPPVPVPEPMPVPVPIMGPSILSELNLPRAATFPLPVTVSPSFPGHVLLAALGEIDAQAPANIAYLYMMDGIPRQRLEAVELLCQRAAQVGATGIVGLRLENDAAGNVNAFGQAVVLAPM